MQEVIAETERKTPFELAAKDYGDKLRRTEVGRFANRMMKYAHEGEAVDARRQAFSSMVSVLVSTLKEAPQEERGRILDEANITLYRAVGTGEDQRDVLTRAVP